jgi:hypothetical protein
MAELAVFPEKDAVRILRVIAELEASGLLRPKTERVDGLPGETILNEPPITRVYNDSGQTVPPYGLMQMSTTLDEDGRNYVKIKRPIDSTLLRCPLLINGPTEIAVGGYGCAQQGPKFRLLHDGGTYVAGDRLGSKTGTFTATYGALFSVIGADAIETNIVQVMFDTSAFKGKTTASGLTVGTPGNVYFMDADGTVTSREYLAETDQTNIEADTYVWLFPMYGRLVAAEIC